VHAAGPNRPKSTKTEQRSKETASSSIPKGTALKRRTHSKARCARALATPLPLSIDAERAPSSPHHRACTQHQPRTANSHRVALAQHSQHVITSRLRMSAAAARLHCVL